ncbi:sensor histidine kinase, partial [Methylobacterium sp. WL18]
MPGRSVMGVAVESDPVTMPAAAAAAREVPERRPARLGLSGRLFLVTVAFVVVAEVLTYVPAVANYRIEWMSDRVAAAQVAALVLDGRTGEPVSEALESRLLAG